MPGVSKITTGIQKDDVVAVFTLKNELVCIGNAMLDSDSLLKEEKGTAVKTTKVFMERGVYKVKE